GKLTIPAHSASYYFSLGNPHSSFSSLVTTCAQLSFAVSFACTASGLTCVDVAHVDKRIIGGTNVVQGTYTWASTTICSGSALSSKWVLTAAHRCTEFNRQIVRSVVEAGNPNVAVGCLCIESRSCCAIPSELSLYQNISFNGVPPNIHVAHSPTCYPHENYTAGKHTFYIALVKLFTPFDLRRPNISVVNLPTTNNSTPPNVNESDLESTCILT
ncbi:hypothetical protein X801_09605, partial [Opisthorchis viverrini]